MTITPISQDTHIQPCQLCIGLYVHLDLNWSQHPFTFSSFKIKTQEQITAIQALGLTRVRINPDRSDAAPLPVNTARPPPTSDHHNAPPQHHATEQPDAMAAARQDRLARLTEQKSKAKACEKALQTASRAVRSISRGVLSRPVETCEIAQTLIDGMANSMLVDADISVQLMADQVGQEDVYDHSLNVAVLSMMLAKELKAPHHVVKQVGMAALLHDVGLLELPSRLVRSTEPLSKPEQLLLQQHTEIGTRIGRQMGLPPEVIQVIGQHHERADGSGYPSHAKAAQMPLMTRIVALVNAYDELCNPPDPAKALTPHEALSKMYSQLRAEFDPLTMGAFVRCMGVYPPGTLVTLSNGATGMVVSQNTTKPLRPIVLIHDPDTPRDEALLINMELEPDVSVTSTLRAEQLSPDALAYLAPRKRTTYFFDHDGDKDGA